MGSGGSGDSRSGEQGLAGRQPWGLPGQDAGDSLPGASLPAISCPSPDFPWAGAGWEGQNKGCAGPYGVRLWETEGDLGQRPSFSVLIYSISAAANTHLSPSFLKHSLTSVVDIWHSGLPTMLPLPIGTLHPLLRNSPSAVLTRDCLKCGQSDPPSWNMRPGAR